MAKLTYFLAALTILHMGAPVQSQLGGLVGGAINLGTGLVSSTVGTAVGVGTGLVSSTVGGAMNIGTNIIGGAINGVANAFGGYIGQLIEIFFSQLISTLISLPFTILKTLLFTLWAQLINFIVQLIDFFRNNVPRLFTQVYAALSA